MTVKLGVVINRKLPGLKSLLEDLPDWRSHPQYTVRELAMGVIFIFLFKRGSRNNSDNANRKGNFSKNITKVFGCRIPDTDTSHLLMEHLSTEILEKIKQSIVQKLIRDKTFARWRTPRKRYCVAIDGTGVHSFKTEPYPNCCYKDSKNGTRTYSSSVMEAKLLCPNGFSISILTEWIINDPDNTKNDKQDCEQKAFVRLSRKLKAAYPQLAICILGDGLYPNDSIFKICKANNWDFIFTFKDGNLTTIWEEITSQKQDNQTTKFEYLGTEDSKLTTYNGYWINNLIYKKHTLHVIENNVQKIKGKLERFVHITNIEINTANFKELSKSGRLRWKIENEGFNTQKNGGYKLTHKYTRKSHKTFCNYYQCLQIAHIINQLNSLSLEYKKTQNKNAHETKTALLEFAIGAIYHVDFDIDQIKEIVNKNCQFRYV